MIWHPFKRSFKNFLGIDVGSSAVKIVELSRWKDKIKLENYGQVSVSPLQKKPFLSVNKNFLSLSAKSVSEAINAVLAEAEIKTRLTVFAIPDFSTFYTTFNLPPMSKEEIAHAVEFEARRHVPLPLSEIALDWISIDDKDTSGEASLKILLVAIPNTVIKQYQAIAQFSNLKISVLEGEVFSLTRALVEEQSKKVIALIDIGSRSTTVSIVDKRVLKASHSFDVSGGELTTVISRSLNVGYKVAEELKKEYGLMPNKERDLRRILLPLIDSMLAEIDKISNNFSKQEGKEVDYYIVAGTSAFLPGLKEYFSEWLKKEVRIADPFSDIIYPPVLEDALKELGPGLVIAVGSALRGFEK